MVEVSDNTWAHIVVSVHKGVTIMTQSVFIASPEGGNGRNVVAYGVLRTLSKQGPTGVFRPIACRRETFTGLLLDTAGAGQDPSTTRGVCPKRARRDGQCARADIVAAYDVARESAGTDRMVIVGSDHSNVYDPQGFTLNAQIAADLQSPVFLAVCTIPRDGDEVKATVDSCTTVIEQAGSQVVGVFVTGCTGTKAADAKQALADSPVPVWTVDKVAFPDEDDPQAGERAMRAFDDDAPEAQVLAALKVRPTSHVTPYDFQHSLLRKAKADRKTIVLPEGSEDRILRAADYLLARDIVDLIIVGDRETLLPHAQSLGLNTLDRAQFQSMEDRSVLEPMARKLCELRAKKGMTYEQALAQLKDPSYFGTMLVVMGKADGLVSGSVNSTANTVRPALQVIKTKPDATLVSGAFLMCFPDHVALFADCAINLNPDARQLAEIALQSAHTARAFGLEPRVGMLSYSTLGSGKGPDVDLMEEATRLVHEREPELPVVGPIQFDAAWSPTVAAAKARGNDVAGHVNVFVFPDLSAGNIGYKAVQRSSGALAIGPVLQGLNRPVNDLSRGALVEDIINTVALTAVSAQA